MSGDDPDCPGDRPAFSYDADQMPLTDAVEEEEGAVGGGDGAVGGASGGDLSAHPSTPRVFCAPESPPDTEENVRHQSEQIVRAFMYERFSRDREEGQLDPNTPSSPELTHGLPGPLSPEAAIGRQLAEIGDDIQQRYQSQFTEMMKSLDGLMTDHSSSFDTFRNVAMRLFQDRDITWGRVVALFCFGYRIAVEKVMTGASGFVRKIVEWICKFLISERITRWIAQHGGWGSAARMAVESLDWPLMVAIAGVMSSLLFLAYRFSSR